jgi:enolase
MNKNKDAIANVLARRVWDSRGRPTIEVEVHLAGGASGRAIAPAGASKGSGEAVDLRDGGPRFGGLDVTRAVAGVNDEIARILRGFNPHNQSQIDGALTALDGTPDRSRLGANAIVATSMAVAHAAAASRGMPLWQSLRAAPGAQLPLPEIQIFGGGAHAGRRVDIQDFMVIAVGATEYAQALEWTAEVYRAGGELLSESGRLSGVADEGGYWPAFDSNEQGLEMLLRAIERAGFVPGDEMAIALDVAASQFGRGGHYRLSRDGRELDSDGMCELLLNWLRRFPIVSIEDPLAEDDAASFAGFTAAIGNTVQVVGDDFLVTNAGRIDTAARDGACNAALIKPNQAGTLSEAEAALTAARSAGWGAIVSARSGESEDTTIVHLAVGWGVPQLKVGSISRSERRPMESRGPAHGRGPSAGNCRRVVRSLGKQAALEPALTRPLHEPGEPAGDRLDSVLPLPTWQGARTTSRVSRTIRWGRPCHGPRGL